MQKDLRINFVELKVGYAELKVAILDLQLVLSAKKRTVIPQNRTNSTRNGACEFICAELSHEPKANNLLD